MFTKLAVLPNGKYAGSVSMVQLIITSTPDSAAASTGKIDINANVFGQ